MARPFFGWLVVGLVAGCRPVPLPSVAAPMAPAAPVERWVDAAALDEGDGSAGKPFKTLGAALAPGALVTLRSGLYRGPFVLPPGVRLQGLGTAVLYLEGEGTVVSAAEARLEGLSVQGGFVGLDARGGVRLKKVHFSGHRRLAVQAAGALAMSDCELEGTVSETTGIAFGEGSRLTLERLRFTGAFRRAIDGTGGTLEAAALVGDGPVQLLHLERTRAVVRGLKASGGRGPAVYVSGGRLELRGAEVLGHEYALLASKAELEVEGFSSDRAHFAGLSTLGATGTLTAVRVVGSGAHGGLQLLESTLTLRRITVRQALATGIIVRLGTAFFEDVTLEQVRAERGASGDDGGDGLQVRGAKVRVQGLVARDLDGSGVFATALAEVQLQQVRCERCRVGALVAERGASVTVKGLVSRGSPAIAVPDQATVVADDVEVTANEAPLWAECQQGAHLKVRRLKSNLEQPRLPCIERE